MYERTDGTGYRYTCDTAWPRIWVARATVGTLSTLAFDYFS